MTLTTLALLALLESAPQAPAPADASPATSDLPPGTKIMKAIPVEEPQVLTKTGAPKTVFSQCRVTSNAIALTFDDGPHPQNTPRLLDMLKERHLKATFFLIGRSAATWPAIVKRIRDEGHELGNHTWDHQQLSRLRESKVMDELGRTHTAIVNACGSGPAFYRPPYGSIRVDQRKVIMEHFHYPTILWDVDTLDWKSPRSIAKVHDTILRDAKPGSIILCHDIHVETINAMPSTLDDMLARGFQFRTVSELIKLEADTATALAAAPVPTAAPGAAPATPPAPPAPAVPVPSAAPAPATSSLPVAPPPAGQ